MNKLNGVDRDALFSTIDAIKKDPTIARFEFRLKNQWVEGGENHSTVNGYHGAKQEFAREKPFALSNGEPPVLLGTDSGPNPVENLLHALAGCMTTSLAYHAAAKGIKVNKIATRFDGDLDLQGFLGLRSDVRRGYQNINVVFDIDADCDNATKQELIETSKRFSPVFDVVTNGTKVNCSLGKISAKNAA